MSGKEAPELKGNSEVVYNRDDSSISTTGNESKDKQSENSEKEIQVGSIKSKEEENCLRYFLAIGIAEKALRIWFDTVIPPDQLENHITKHKDRLKERCKDEQQLSILFPENCPVTSTTFDVATIYQIIRHTTENIQPSNSWGTFPDSEDMKPADDLERVRICRNSFRHGKKSICDEKFKNKWKELKEIIRRLAGGQLDGELDSLENKDLDHSAVERSLADLKRRLKNLEKRVDDHIPQNIREQHEKILEEWEKNDEVFLTTPAYQSARDKIAFLPHVTVSGGPARGKTFLIRHIALELAQEEYEIVPVSSLADITKYGNLNVKQLFVIDDVLGVIGFESNLHDDLKRRSENIMMLLRSGSKLLMSCRSVVLHESEPLKCFVTQANHVVNLDDKQNELKEKDMEDMLEKHCKSQNISEEYFRNLKLPKNLPMFPLLCSLFSTDKTYQKIGESFFLHPFKCIFSQLDALKILNKIHYAGLVYCVIKGNCVRPKSLDTECLEEIYVCCKLDRSTSNFKLIEAMAFLNGSYLIQDTEGRYSFIHDCIFEIVAVHFGRYFQDCLIKRCTSSSIYKLLTNCENGSIGSENLIPVEKDHFSVLVDRIFWDIKHFNLYEVFSGIESFSQNDLFVSRFAEILRTFSSIEIKQMFLDCHTCANLEEKIKNISKEMIENVFKVIEQLFSSIVNHLDSIEFKMQKISPFDFRLLLLEIYHKKVLNWMIAFNHLKLLTTVLDIIKENQLVQTNDCVTNSMSEEIVGNVFGNDLQTQCFCLGLACSSKNLEMVELVSNNVDPKCLTSNEKDMLSPVFVASVSDCNDIVIFLLEKGALVDFSLPDLECSGLFFSCIFGFNDVAETLIKNGADVNLCPFKELSPINIATVFCNENLVKLLEAEGAVRTVIKTKCSECSMTHFKFDLMKTGS